MTRMEVKSTERGMIRLFMVDLPPEDLNSFNTRSVGGGIDAWPLRDSLGAGFLDQDFVEYFDISDLEELGLMGYMTEGLGIAAKDVEQDTARLANLSGQVLIVFSAAFDGKAQTLTPKAPLRWIGTYREDAAPVTFSPLPDASAKGIGAPVATPPNNPHLTVLWAVLALPVLALILGAVIYGATR